jgi:hypothetical protein
MPIDQQRTGPAIRYWEFARVLSAEQRVTLLLPNDEPLTHPDFAVCPRAGADLDSLLAAHQVVVVQGPALQEHPRLAQGLSAGRHYLVVDLYDPITLEQLEIEQTDGASPWLLLEYTALLNEQLRLGDFFLCASERQRDYWLGALAALGRINHTTYDGAELRRLIDVVPFGLPTEPPNSGSPVLKGTHSGIDPDDHLILWGGGLWDWLDPLTPIRAMDQVKTDHPTARLVFFESDRHQSAMLGQAKSLAAEMELLGHQVIFAGWVPPEQWGACLLEADVGLSFHPASVETHFAFRTRLLDYIWAGLPIVAARGDVLSDLVAAHGLGHVVQPGDEGALAGALVALLDEPNARSNRHQSFHQVSAQFWWDRVTQPLVHYCRQPWPAGDQDGDLYGQWHAAKTDQLVANAAHAERRLAETQVQAEQQAAHLQAQIEEMTAQLRQSEEQLEAALSGRVLQLMTSIQRALRGGRQ